MEANLTMTTVVRLVCQIASVGAPQIPSVKLHFTFKIQFVFFAIVAFILLLSTRLQWPPPTFASLGSGVESV